MLKNKTVFSLLVLLLLVVSCNDELDKSAKLDVEIVLKNASQKDVENGRTEAYVESPSSGTFYPGNVMHIAWQWNGFGDWQPAIVKLELYKGNTFVRHIANRPFQDQWGIQSYEWTVPSLTSYGNDFKIRMTDYNNPSNYDDSNNFSILSTTTPPPPPPPVPGVSEISPDWVFDGTQCAWENQRNDGRSFQIWLGQGYDIPQATITWSGGENYINWPNPGPSPYNESTTFRAKRDVTFPQTFTIQAKVTRPGYSDVIKSRVITLQDCVFYD